MIDARAVRVAVLGTTLVSVVAAGTSRAQQPVVPVGRTPIVAVGTQTTPDSAGIVDVVNDKLPKLAKAGAVSDRLVHRFTQDSVVYAAVLDFATISGESADARVSIVRLTGDFEVIASETTSGPIEAAEPNTPRYDPERDPSVTEEEGYVVCVKKDPMLVYDEECEAKKDLAAAAALAICATSIFVNPVLGALACAAAQTAVSQYECKAVLVTPPPFCQRFYPEPAEPAVQQAEETSGQSRPHPCNTPSGDRNPACDQ